MVEGSFQTSSLLRSSRTKSTMQIRKWRNERGTTDEELASDQEQSRLIDDSLEVIHSYD